jgi:hypothetical protein
LAFRQSHQQKQKCLVSHPIAIVALPGVVLLVIAALGNHTRTPRLSLRPWAAQTDIKEPQSACLQFCVFFCVALEINQLKKTHDSFRCWMAMKPRAHHITRTSRIEQPLSSYTGKT